MTTIPERLIIGIDPGLACGFATLDGDVFGSLELTRPEAEDELERLIKRGRPAIVSVERFTFQKASSKMTRQYDALEFIGVARFLCRKYGVSLMITGASDAAKIGSAENLRALGWWKRGVKDHVHRASSQVAYVLAQTHPDEFERRLSPSTI